GPPCDRRMSGAALGRMCPRRASQGSRVRETPAVLGAGPFFLLAGAKKEAPRKRGRLRQRVPKKGHATFRPILTSFGCMKAHAFAEKARRGAPRIRQRADNRPLCYSCHMAKPAFAAA